MCPYAKDESSDDEENHNVKKGRKPHNHEKGKHEKNKNSYKYNKNLYSKGVSDSSKERSESSFDSDREETLLMEIETNIDEDKGI